MVILTLLSWWYRQGWMQVFERSGERLIQVSHLFSLPILLRTLWAPWRRIVSYPGASIDEKLRALGDNLVSRAIGFTVRTLVLIAAALIMLLTACFGGLTLVLWPLVPPLIIFSLIKGIIG